MAKSAWSGVCCSTDRDRAKAHSWFSSMVPGDWGLPLKCDVQEHLETGREMAIRALYRSPRGPLKEALRRKTRAGVTLTMRVASPGVLKGFRLPEIG